MNTATSLITSALIVTGLKVSAATLYVSLESRNPVVPYSTWATAATNIQDAVDAASAGDEIIATNGLYATGQRAVGSYYLLNRVTVDKRLTLRSANGPGVTTIQGYQIAGTTNGYGAIRCVYLADGAVLSGFTLTNGATLSDGGGVWCKSTTAVVSNCVLIGNSAAGEGGGACGGTLKNCKLTGNSAGYGGGASGSSLSNCTVSENVALARGGGVCGGTLNNCLLTMNSAGGGGGAYYGTLNNCTLTGNSATAYAGGEYGCTLNNCIVYFNTAPQEPNYSNKEGTTMNYCCTTPLPVPGVGNIDLDPQLASTWRLSVFSPCRGAGNAAYATGCDMDGEPWGCPPSVGCDEYCVGRLAGPLTVSIKSDYTSVSVGFPLVLTAAIQGPLTLSVWDFGDGDFGLDQPWATHAWTTPGDYLVALWAFNETHPEGVKTTIRVEVLPMAVHYVVPTNDNPTPPYLSWATAATNIQDAVDAATTPGALVLVTNGVYATGGRVVLGSMTNRVAVEKPMTLRSVNGPTNTIIQGHQVPGTTNGDGAVRCVYLRNGASLSGFTLTGGATRTNGDYTLDQCGGGVWCEPWTTSVSDCLLVTNSAYSYGGGACQGMLSNCSFFGNVALNGGAAAWATLNRCLVAGNSVLNDGGGASSCTLNYCSLIGNSAAFGGGVSDCTLNNCVVTGNTAGGDGGGAASGTLNNCTLTGNSAGRSGGGVGPFWMEVRNCIVYFNTAPEEPNFTESGWVPPLLSYCCTVPMPTNGIGNITNAPLFLDYPGGNLRPQSNSPCINAGNNSYLSDSQFTNPFDVDGNPRIVSGTVDIGAYEYQGAGSVISYAWLQQYGLPTDGSVDHFDIDNDGHNTWQEWRCWTDPTNTLSALRLVSATQVSKNVNVTWQSVAGVNYSLERSTNLASPFMPIATGILGQSGTTVYTDTNAARFAPIFYRVGVAY